MRKKWTPVTCFAKQEELEQDLARAGRFDRAWVGERFLFYEGVLRIRYLALDEIAWAYLRRREIPVAVGCRRCLVPDYRLMLLTTGGITQKLPVDSGEDATLAIERMCLRNRSIAAGYSPQHAARFAR